MGHFQGLQWPSVLPCVQTMEPVDKLLQCVDPVKDRELWVRENKTGEIRPVDIEIWPQRPPAILSREHSSESKTPEDWLNSTLLALAGIFSAPDWSPSPATLWRQGGGAGAAQCDLCCERRCQGCAAGFAPLLSRLDSRLRWRRERGLVRQWAKGNDQGGAFNKI